jgi:hypothetical protein
VWGVKEFCNFIGKSKFSLRLSKLHHEALHWVTPLEQGIPNINNLDFHFKGGYFKNSPFFINYLTHKMFTWGYNIYLLFLLQEKGSRLPIHLTQYVDEHRHDNNR